MGVMGVLFVRRRIGAVAAALVCTGLASLPDAVAASGSDVSTDVDSLTAGRTSKEWVVVLGQIDMRLSRGLGVHIDNRGDTSVRSRNIRIDNVFVSGASSHAVET